MGIARDPCKRGHSQGLLQTLTAERGLAGLYLIHGFNSGNKIKTYIRGGSLQNSLTDRGIKSKIFPLKGNPGTSAIIFLNDE